MKGVWGNLFLPQDVRRAHFLFLNIFSTNRKIRVGDALSYLLLIDLFIHARNIGRMMRDALTIKLLQAKGRYEVTEASIS